jgi:NADPH-dependent glutamate synthase beta subunit-like oxidoreductase
MFELTDDLTDDAVASSTPNDDESPVPAPCRAHCPLGVDVPRYVRHVARGEFTEAAELIRDSVPLPSVLGYVCSHPCEDACRRSRLDAPVAICNLKRFAMDEHPMTPSPVLPEPTGKRVAVVGSGPAGLSAAWFLRRQGHHVTVFEKLERPGGLLAVGTPAYRLPWDVLHRDLKAIREAGVKFELEWEPPESGAESLLDEDHDAVFVATGAHRGREIGVGNGDVIHGVDFLRSVSRAGVHGAETIPGSRVLVIGGGNVAIDVARTAVRIGADAVTILSLESVGGMPAYAWEVREAREEGVRLHHSWGPKAVERQDGRITGLEARRCTRVFDDDGNFDPAYDEGETRLFPCDAIVQAVGQTPDFRVFAQGDRTVLRDVPGRRFLRSLERERVYAGGDVTGRTGSVVEAIAAGREAAEEIGRLFGTSLPDSPPPDTTAVCPEPRDPVRSRPRVRPERIDDSLRCASVEPIELTYSRDQAVAEARRCLACDPDPDDEEPPSDPDEP